MYKHFPLVDCRKIGQDQPKGHHLCNHGSTWVPNATYQVSRSLVNWFWGRRFLKVFTIYGHGGHIWSCDLEGLYKFLFPQPKEALKEIWLYLAQWGIGGVDV